MPEEAGFYYIRLYNIAIGRLSLRPVPPAPLASVPRHHAKTRFLREHTSRCQSDVQGPIHAQNVFLPIPTP